MALIAASLRVFRRLRGVIGEHVWNFADFAPPRRCTGPAATTRRVHPRSVGSTTSTAVIWFIVSVPVLSELIAEVNPSVSTDGRSLTIALCFASSTLPSYCEHERKR